MSEIIALSSDITVITAEINSYKQVAGQAIFEIGRRLKHVRELRIAEKKGGWDKWCEDELGFTRRTANRMIQAHDQFGSGTTSSQLSSAKMFELLSLPEVVDRAEFLEQPHTVPSTGEQKTVDEMTVKELREVKKSLHDAESRLKKAQDQAQQATESAEHANEKIGVLQDKLDLERIEKRRLKEAFEKAGSGDVRRIMVETDESKKRIADLERQLAEKEHLLQDREAWAASDPRNLESEFIAFHTRTIDYLDAVAMYRYLNKYDAAVDGLARGQFLEAIDGLEDFCSSMRTALNGRQDIIREDIVIRPLTKMLTDEDVKIS